MGLNMIANDSITPYMLKLISSPAATMTQPYADCEASWEGAPGCMVIPERPCT